MYNLILKTLIVPMNLNLIGSSVVNEIKESIIEAGKSLTIYIATGLGEVCIMVCGLALLWYIVDNKSLVAKKYMIGSYIIYFGLKLTQFLLT